MVRTVFIRSTAHGGHAIGGDVRVGFLRLVGLSVLVTALLGGCATGRAPDGQRSASPETVAKPAPEPTVCPEQGVVVQTGSSDAAMGLRVQDVELVNCGRSPFTVNGYPALSVLDEEGDPLDIEIVHGTAAIASIPGLDTTPAAVVLQPGDRAVATLVWRNLVTDATVEAANGAQLAVAPAVGDPWQIVSPRGRVDLGNTGRLGITAWRPPKAA